MLAHRLRHVPLFPTIFNPGPGVRVEGYLHDCWWPGEVVEQHFRKGYRICFDDGDNAWLVRRNVRPMLKRAPEPGTWRVADVQGATEDQNGLGIAGTPPKPPMPMRFPHGINPHEVVGALRVLLEGRDWSTLRLDAVEAELEATIMPHLAPGWLRPRRHALVAAMERALMDGLNKPPPSKRTKHRLLSPAAGRDAKRPKNAAYSREGLLYKPLLRTALPAGLALVPLAATLRGLPRLAASKEEAEYILQCIGPEVLFMLAAEQFALHNAPPPLPPPAEEPPATAPSPYFQPAAAAAAAAASATASLATVQRTASAESFTAADTGPDASFALDDDDGVVRCEVVGSGPSWRRTCAMCSAAVFNIFLRAGGDAEGEGGAEASRSSADGTSAEGAGGGVDVCTDCWSAVVGGSADWPLGADGSLIGAAAFRPCCELPPELAAETSRRLQHILSPEVVAASASDAASRPPLGGPLTAEGLRRLREGDSPPTGMARLHARGPTLNSALIANGHAQPPASKEHAKPGWGAKPPAGRPPPSKPPPHGKKVGCGGGGGASSSSFKGHSSGHGGAAVDMLTVVFTATPPDGLPAPEIGPGWHRISKARATDPIGRHLDHVFIAPDGRRFNSKIKCHRYLTGDLSADAAPPPKKRGGRGGRQGSQGGRGGSARGGVARGGGARGGESDAAEDEHYEDEGVWVACDRCGKWRHLNQVDPPECKVWHCEDNPNERLNHCEAPEESWEQEEEWVEEEVGEAKQSAEAAPSAEAARPPTAAPSEAPPNGRAAKGGKAAGAKATASSAKAAGAKVADAKAAASGKVVANGAKAAASGAKAAAGGAKVSGADASASALEHAAHGRERRWRPDSDEEREEPAYVPSPSASRSARAAHAAAEGAYPGGAADVVRVQGRAARVPVVISSAIKAALAKVKDCDECKFCKDKPKNGGANTMRQRCIAKQEVLRKLQAEEAGATLVAIGGEAAAASAPSSATYMPAQAPPPRGCPAGAGAAGGMHPVMAAALAGAPDAVAGAVPMAAPPMMLAQPPNYPQLPYTSALCVQLPGGMVVQPPLMAHMPQMPHVPMPNGRSCTWMPTSAPTQMYAPFGAAAPLPTPFGAAAPLPTPFGAAAPLPTPFGAAAPTPTPFGAAAPPAAAPEASERLAGHPLLAPAEMVKPDEEGAAAGGGAQPMEGVTEVAGEEGADEEVAMVTPETEEEVVMVAPEPTDEEVLDEAVKQEPADEPAAAPIGHPLLVPVADAAPTAAAPATPAAAPVPPRVALPLVEVQLSLSTQDGRALPSPPRKMARRMGEEAWAADAHSTQPFRTSFGQGQPVVVGGVGGRLQLPWTPEVLSRLHGAMPVTLVEVAEGEQHAFEGCTLGAFLGGFEAEEARPRPPRWRDGVAAMSGGASSSSASSSRAPLLKLRAWPSAGSSLRELLPQHCDELLSALPFGAYTRPDGAVNLAAFLPPAAVAPDLGPRCSCAYGAGEGGGESGGTASGTTALHVGLADAVHVLVHASGGCASADGASADGTSAAPSADGTSAAPAADPAGSALWHIFSQSDSRQLESALPRLMSERGLRGGEPSLLASTQPLLDGSLYLDEPTLALLYAECSLVPYTVLQREGDALLVPAGCAAQVRHLRSCILVGLDFVAPENVGHCVRLTEELRQLPAAHPRRPDVLGVRSIMLHAAWACLATLDDAKRREEHQRRALAERNRRQAAKLAKRQASAEPPAAAAAEAEPPSEPMVDAGSVGEVVASALMLA